MKFISPHIHGLIDYLSVVFFLLSPAVFGFTGLTAIFAYALGGLHLLLTVFTNFRLGIVKIVPVGVHAVIEVLTGIALIVLAWTVFKDNKQNSSLYFDIVGTVVLLTWAVTDYKGVHPESGALRG